MNEYDEGQQPVQRRTDDLSPIIDKSTNSLPQNEGMVSIVGLWRNFLTFWKSASLIVVAVTAFAVAYALLVKPIYRSEVLIAPASEQEQQGLAALAGQFGGLASLAGISVGGQVQTNEAIAILQSREFTAAFITDENLMPVLFADRWDDEQGAWAVSSPERTPTMADALKVFNEEIREVREDKRTGLVSLRVEWSDRHLAARWANVLIQRLNDKIRARKISEAERSIAFLNSELEKSPYVEMHQAIYRLIEHQIETIMIANVRQEYAFKVLDPAIASDVKKYVWPKKRLIVMAGFVVGFFIAALYVMVRVSIRDAVQIS